MNLCPRCGTAFKEEHKFCGFCGFNLSASETCELATQVSLKAADLRLNLGKAYYEVGKYEQALQTFEQFLTENPDNAEARRLCELTRDAINTVSSSGE